MKFWVFEETSHGQPIKFVQSVNARSAVAALTEVYGDGIVTAGNPRNRKFYHCSDPSQILFARRAVLPEMEDQHLQALFAS